MQKCPFDNHVYFWTPAANEQQLGHRVGRVPVFAGLLRRQDGPRSAFAAIKRPLRLLVDDVDDKAPADIAYTFSGYAPLSVRLIEVGQLVIATFR